MSDKIKDSPFTLQVLDWIGKATQQNQSSDSDQQNQSDKSDQSGGLDQSGDSNQSNDSEGRGSSKGKFGNWDEHTSGDGKDDQQNKNTDTGEGSGIGNNTLDGTKPNTQPITAEDIRQAMNDAEQIGKMQEKSELGAGNGAGDFMRKMIDKRKRITQPWRTILKRFMTQVGYVRSYARINSRMAGARVVSPSKQQIQKPKSVIVAVDVSGSMSDETLDKIANEVNALSKLPMIDSIRLWHWDATVQSDITIKKGKTISTNNGSTAFNFLGGGGTVIDCVYDYIMQNNIEPTGVCYITDGFVNGDKFYIKNHCLNTVLITKEGDSKTLNDVAKKYGRNLIQVYQTDL